MKIDELQIVGMRCFDDTGPIHLGPGCNIFVGQNNSGKSTILRAILAYQGFLFSEDIRPNASRAYTKMALSDVDSNAKIAVGAETKPSELKLAQQYKGNTNHGNSGHTLVHTNQPVFYSARPYHQLVPFLARRKAINFDHSINSGVLDQLTGTLSNLYSRIDHVDSTGHPRNVAYKKALKDVVGVDITTRASRNGKEAGYYFDIENFISLEKMGDGVSEMVALIVELCLEKRKIFVIEEPETNQHPKGLKALLRMIREAAKDYQFIIATHSNIVVRELGYDENSRVFRVFRDDDNPNSPSHVELVPPTTDARITLLKELGYDFADLELHDAWLFLEEASAEQVINKILIPKFVPSLVGRLRTYSAGGVSKIEASLEEFQRLVVFVHLQPAYQGRTWVRVDNNEDGAEIVKALRTKFSHLTESTCRTFSQPDFEHYYPSVFSDRVATVLAIENRKQRQTEKIRLMNEVLEWTKNNEDTAVAAWEMNAREPIEVLKSIKDEIL